MTGREPALEQGRMDKALVAAVAERLIPAAGA